MSMLRQTLLIPKAEAERQLNAQIDQGNTLIIRIDKVPMIVAAATKSMFDNLWLAKGRYTKNNKLMLSQMLGDQGVAESFDRFDSRIHFPHEPFNPYREFELINGIVKDEINELRSILEGLQYIPEMSTPEVPAPLAQPNNNQSMQTDGSQQSNGFVQTIEAHPLKFVLVIILATAGITFTITREFYTARIEYEKSKFENEKSRYEAMIENQKKDYESQLRELRTRVKELESRATGKDSQTSPSDK